jgi:hypothetical protein
LSTRLPAQIEVSESADGVRFRLPPPAGTWYEAGHEIWLTAGGMLRWQSGADGSSPATEIAVGNLAKFEVDSFGPLAVLTVETKQGVSHAMFTGYPRDWLDALAVELSHRCQVSTRSVEPIAPSLLAPLAALVGQPATIDAAGLQQMAEAVGAIYQKVMTARFPGAFQEEPDQPATSRVVCEQRDNGVTLTVPPGGFGPFFLLGCGLCAFAMLPTIAGFVTGFRTEDGSFGPLWLTASFWALALAVILPAYHHARAQVTLTVVGDELEVVVSSVLRTRRYSWKRNELADVRSGDNGWASGGDESNLTPVAQLHIFPKYDKKVGLLAGRDATEIRWIATVLRHALRLPHSSPDGNPAPDAAIST